MRVFTLTRRICLRTEQKTETAAMAKGQMQAATQFCELDEISRNWSGIGPRVEVGISVERDAFMAVRGAEEKVRHFHPQTILPSMLLLACTSSSPPFRIKFCPEMLLGNSGINGDDYPTLSGFDETQVRTTTIFKCQFVMRMTMLLLADLDPNEIKSTSCTLPPPFVAIGMEIINLGLDGCELLILLIFGILHGTLRG